MEKVVTINSEFSLCGLIIILGTNTHNLYLRACVGRISIIGHTDRQAVNFIIIIMKVLYCTAGGWGGAFYPIIRPDQLI